MRAALDIALKDLKQKVRDRSALLISIVAPFSLAASISPASTADRATSAVA